MESGLNGEYLYTEILEDEEFDEEDNNSNKNEEDNDSENNE